MIKFNNELPEEYKQIFTKDAINFIGNLHILFSSSIQTLLEEREAPLEPQFSETTASIREADWKAAPIPDDLLDRRVEITGPVDRKMIINALNSGANVFMADFEDSTSPTWENVINGQINLRDAVNGTISFFDAKKDKRYALNDKTATLMVRPRGLHLLEKHLSVNNELVPACLVDFGLYFFHNAKNLVKNGTGPYFYIPKLESHLEAKLWRNIFFFSEEFLEIPHGSIRATVLLETLPAAFQMDEILWELKEYSAGLNCGRWDYIFSFIKKFKNDETKVLPDRDQITMDQSFLDAYSRLLIKTCHRRGVHAMGGMAAQIPIKNDPEANETALNKVFLDKKREVLNGHDGTWVAHPALVKIARDVFDTHMKTPNQIDIPYDHIDISEEDLVSIPDGTITLEGVRKNISVGIKYIEAWLGGNGCVPLNNLMEDAATAEISRTQIWQWLYHKAVLENGQSLTKKLFLDLVGQEVEIINKGYYDDSQFNHNLVPATELFLSLCTNSTLEEFLTLPAYEAIN